MIQRIHPAQWYENRVIETLVTREMAHAVYPNLGGHHNACITIRGRELYPDLILCDRETLRIEHVMEVETEELVTEEKAKQWALETHGPWKFWLVVPRVTLDHASLLCERFGVRARMIPWSALPDGIEIEWPSPVWLKRHRATWWRSS